MDDRERAAVFVREDCCCRWLCRKSADCIATRPRISRSQRKHTSRWRAKQVNEVRNKNGQLEPARDRVEVIFRNDICVVQKGMSELEDWQ